MTSERLTFVAPDGSYWTVHEVTNDRHRPWAGRSLIFVSDAGFRRVYDFPDHWRTLSPSDLYDLSWKK